VGTYNLDRCRALTDRSDALLLEALGCPEVWEELELLHAKTVRKAAGKRGLPLGAKELRRRLVVAAQAPPKV